MMNLGGSPVKTRSVSESCSHSPSAHTAKSNDLNVPLSSIAKPNAFSSCRYSMTSCWLRFIQPATRLKATERIHREIIPVALADGQHICCTPSTHTATHTPIPIQLSLVRVFGQYGNRFSIASLISAAPSCVGAS